MTEIQYRSEDQTGERHCHFTHTEALPEWLRLAAETEPEGGEDVVRCDRCGCTEDEPCAGGCEWADDPERPDRDVCSRCLDDYVRNADWLESDG